MPALPDRPDPAVLGAEGLREPVRDLGVVLDPLAGQHPHPHPIHRPRGADAEQGRDVVGAAPLDQEAGGVHRGRPLPPVDEAGPPPRPHPQPHLRLERDRPADPPHDQPGQQAAEDTEREGGMHVVPAQQDRRGHGDGRGRGRGADDPDAAAGRVAGPATAPAPARPRPG